MVVPQINLKGIWEVGQDLCEWVGSGLKTGFEGKAISCVP